MRVEYMVVVGEGARNVKGQGEASFSSSVTVGKDGRGE
jgi:hypothetical protein